MSHDASLITISILCFILSPYALASPFCYSSLKLRESQKANEESESFNFHMKSFLGFEDIKGGDHSPFGIKGRDVSTLVKELGPSPLKKGGVSVTPLAQLNLAPSLLNMG